MCKNQNQDLKNNQDLESNQKHKNKSEVIKNKNHTQNNVRDLELAFEQVYSAYPKKQNRTRALQEFKKTFTNYNITIESLLQAIENLIEYYKLKKIDNRYIPFLGNWLKCERWNDSYDLKKLNNTQNKFANFEQRTWDFEKIERLAQGDFD